MNDDKIITLLESINDKLSRVLLTLNNTDNLIKIDNAVNYLCGQEIAGMTDKEAYFYYKELHDKFKVPTNYMTIKNVNNAIRENTDCKLYNTTRDGRFARVWRK